MNFVSLYILHIKYGHTLVQQTPLTHAFTQDSLDGVASVLLYIQVCGGSLKMLIANLLHGRTQASIVINYMKGWVSLPFHYMGQIAFIMKMLIVKYRSLCVCLYVCF